MKILITGAKGQLGWELMRRGEAKGGLMTGVDLPEVDLCIGGRVHETVQSVRPDLVINAAAYTNVDGAESDAETCFQVNENLPRRLAKACRAAGMPLVHVSTDFVFHAPRSTPWDEDAPVSPQGVYATAKAAGETAVRDSLDAHVIVRTAWLYGIRGKNFVKTMLSLARDREEIGVVADQVGCPTFAGDLAEVLLAMAGKLDGRRDLPWGTYHYCGGGQASWHDFARTAIDLARQDGEMDFRLQRIRALSTAEYPTPAVRPAYSVLDCTKIQRAMQIVISPWEARLAAVMEDLLAAWKANQ